MSAIYISALIIVIVLNIFMFIALKNIVGAINKETKSYFVEKLQNYDELIKVKEDKLKQIEEELNKSNKVGDYDNSEIQDNTDSVELDINVPNYLNEDVFKQYKKINETFIVKEEEIIKNFIDEKLDTSDLSLYNTLDTLNNKFSFDKMYELSTLSSDEQISILKDIINDDEVNILEEYINNNETFNVLDFNKYIDEEMLKHDPVVYVKTGNSKDNFDNLNKYIKTIYDEEICAGIQIIYKDKIYDYALQ